MPVIVGEKSQQQIPRKKWWTTWRKTAVVSYAAFASLISGSSFGRNDSLSAKSELILVLLYREPGKLVSCFHGKATTHPSENGWAHPSFQNLEPSARRPT